MKHFNLFSLKNWSETNVVKGTRNYMASGTRTLLLALTLLCGVSNAWGACYYTISSAPTTINVVETGKGAFGVKLYNFPDTELGTFTNTYGVTSITFSFKKDGGTNTANVKLQYYDGTSWTDAVNSDGGKITCKAKNKETDNVNQKINPSSPTGQAIKYRLVRTDNPDFTSSDRYFTISNLTLQMNTTFSSDALVTIANTKIDESNEGYFDVSYSNMEGKTLSVTSSNPNEFIVSDVALDCSGTKSVTVTYKPTCEHHEESATITLKIDDVEKARVTANASWALNDGQAVNWRTLTDAEKKIQKGQSLDISSYASAKYSNGEGAVYYTSSNSGVISVGSDGHTLTAVSVGTAQIKAHVGNGCKYSGASSSEVTFTVSDKATPKFTPNWTSTNLKVGDKVTLTVENVSDGLNGYFKGTATKDNGKDILGITRFGNTITIEALNAGNSTATFTQTETGDIFGANPSYSFSVTKIANTLTVDATHSMYVDDIWNSVISGKNSDGAITTTTTDGTVAYYDVANNKIVAQNTNSQSFNSKEVTITISQADTYKYTAASKTITIIVNKYDNAIDIKGHGSSYSRDIYVGEVWDFSLSSNHTSSPIIATQNSGSDVAVMNSDHTQVISNSKEGQATWSISQPETYKYKEATGSLTVNVKKMGEESCEVVNKGETEYSEKLGNNTSEITWSEANVAEKLYFRAHRQSGSVEDKIQAQQKVNGSWQNVGNAITDMGTSYGSEYSIPLNQAATGVRFNIAGSFKNFVKNVRITRKKYLTTTSSLTINKNTSGGTLLVGESGTATLHVDWSICNGGELKVSSSDPRFTLSQTTISDATDGTNGSKDITVTYTPSEAGTFNADITVYNKVYRETTAVTGIAKAVPQITTPPSTTAVTYGQLLSNSNLSGGEAKAVVNGTLTGIEGSFAWENPNEVVTKAAGAQQYNVIFTPSKTDLYNNASGKATVTVNKATPTLTVTSPDTQKVYLDDTQTPKLDLVNYVTEYSAENDTHGHAQQKSAITYTCDKTSTGKIENGKFYATAEGTYTITATAPATDYYDKVEKTFTITVVKNENPITFQAGSSTVTTTTVDCESSSVVTVVTASTGALSVSAVQNGITPTISGKTLTFAAAAGSSNETATFTVSQATTTKYKAGSATITIYVKPIFRFAAVANVGPVKQGTVSASVTETSKIENYQTTSSSTTATFSATPNSGYHFDGWYTSSDCTGSAESTDSPYTPTITNTSAGSTTTKTLYAKFTANQHTLSWSTDGNPLTGNYTQGTVDFGTPIIQPNTPTKSGYTFAGWNATVPATMPDNDLSYTAQWTANSYTVTLDGNGGSGGSASVTATFGAAMPSADAPTRTGYTFQGYYDQKEGGTQYYNNDMSSAHAWDKAAATTLYAHWTANIYRVKLYANGGAFDNAGTPVSELWQDVAYGSPMPSGNPKPTRTGLEFIGFYDENGVQY
ncbi:MAG: InlB B-repeat-containing protein, partial [Paludibacteraceae bacterium]|nr:InlB B-repeat-containing protein [Paludibacteraceae bacterium]